MNPIMNKILGRETEIDEGQFITSRDSKYTAQSVIDSMRKLGHANNVIKKVMDLLAKHSDNK
tara:strand:+ start:764 stop:949 length:186 start_codon:yes stop_codon:yes gene_type:complete